MYIPFKLLPKFMKKRLAEELKDFISLVTDLKTTKCVASTYLSSSSLESYLASVDKTEENYNLVDVSSSSGGLPSNNFDFDKIEQVERIIDKDGTVGLKLFDGKNYPDIYGILAEIDIIDEAEGLAAEIVVALTSQYTDSGPGFMSFGHHNVYLKGVALVPKD
ncbi:MAG: hypothetical protein GQ477_06430 [Nanohaloarchaea archaeon]|nr:hypothetical protein [Candidatus Nanohaloarchaea archaeon]